MNFYLDGLHSSYGRVVVDTIWGLVSDYPGVQLQTVSLFQRDDDLSIANASKIGEISLNYYWFSQPIDVLRNAARERNIVYIGDNLPIAWHGDMEEPHHVLAHEFGHCMQDVLPAWREFSEMHWLASCRDPVNCRPVSGYALAGPDEWWGDTFAANRLYISCEATRLLAQMLRENGVG